MAIGDNIKALANRIEQKSNAAVRKGVAEASDYVTFGTPVDVGTARSNWRASIGAESTSVRGAYSPYPKLFSKEKTKATDRYEVTDLNYAKSIERSGNVINKWKPSNGKSLFISNPLDYVQQLSDTPGYSLQPPSLKFYRWIKRTPFSAIRQFRKEELM